MFSHEFTPIYVLFVLSLCVWFSEWLAQNRWIKRYGAALIVIIITAIVANLGFLPTKDHIVYDGIFTYVAPAAIFLLLLDVNLRELRKVGMPMLVLFLVGSAGTALGVLVATIFVKDGPLFEGVYAPLAGMITGTYTGGALNFNAVALHYGVMEKGVVFAGAIAVDNIVTALWMFCTLMIPWLFGGTKRSPKVTIAPTSRQESNLSILNLSLLVAMCILALWMSEWLAGYAEKWLGFTVPSILIITTLALVLAQIPKVSRLPMTHKFGVWLVYLFLAVIGAYCDISALGSAGQLALLLLLFILITIAVHILLIIIVARIFRWDWEFVSIASQANIGGSTTAMALAQSFNRNELVLPAIVVGSLGNALGTYLGFLIAALV